MPCITLKQNNFINAFYLDFDLI